MKGLGMKDTSDRVGRSAYQSGFLYTIILVSLFVLILCVPYVEGTPPEYKSFHRDQLINYPPNEDDLMQIWMVYVGQGDGLLIQLPPKYNYDLDLNDGDPKRTERLDVMIDGGSSTGRDAARMEEFLHALYPDDIPVIEHAVISHHDSDHVIGLTHILEEGDIEVRRIYHNGLASYKPDTPPQNPRFRRTEKLSDAVYSWTTDHVTKGMGRLQSDGISIDGKYLIHDLSELQKAQAGGELHRVYENLADAIVSAANVMETKGFPRAHKGAGFIKEWENRSGRGIDLNGVEFEIIWPLETLRGYGAGSRDWGKTINGNSVTFRLKYGNFEMLFMGDHNKESEEALLDSLGNDADVLSCDVFKVPHHASHDASKIFFTRDGFDPVVSVASMGEQGFKSKKLYNKNWQHPATEVIRWLGGSHRVYHTLIHEKRFKWDKLETLRDHQKMYERSHILIETDGEWFRIVEVDVEGGDPNTPPTVMETRRGDGTRWIEAKLVE